jgi:hypothetical protein
VTDARGFHARITVRIHGALAASGWSGTLGVTVMVSHRGKVVDTCSASRLTWSAAPVG